MRDSIFPTKVVYLKDGIAMRDIQIPDDEGFYTYLYLLGFKKKLWRGDRLSFNTTDYKLFELAIAYHNNMD